MLDVITWGIAACIAYQVRSIDAVSVLIAFSITLLYSISPSFDVHEGWANHAIYLLAWLSATPFLSKWPCIAVLAYSVVHWLRCGFFIFFPEANQIAYNVYIVFAVSFEYLILASLISGRSRRRLFCFDNLGFGWLPNLIRVHLAKRSHK